MRSVAIAAGVGVLAAWLFGGIPTAYVLGRRRIQASSDLRTLLTGSASDDLVVPVLDVAKVLLAATFVWHLVAEVSPGGTATRPSVGAVGFLADQVLVAWQSAALWAGLAALVGHLAPPWLGFRSSGGIAPAGSLAVVYAPLPFVIGVVGFFVALVATRRPTVAALAGVAAFTGWTWLSWVQSLGGAWGAPPGPELALWASVLSGVVAARVVVADRAQ